MLSGGIWSSRLWSVRCSDRIPPKNLNCELLYGAVVLKADFTTTPPQSNQMEITLLFPPTFITIAHKCPGLPSFLRPDLTRGNVSGLGAARQLADRDACELGTLRIFLSVSLFGRRIDSRNRPLDRLDCARIGENSTSLLIRLYHIHFRPQVIARPQIQHRAGWLFNAVPSRMYFSDNAQDDPTPSILPVGNLRGWSVFRFPPCDLYHIALNRHPCQIPAPPLGHGSLRLDLYANRASGDQLSLSAAIMFLLILTLPYLFAFLSIRLRLFRDLSRPRGHFPYPPLL